MRGEKVVNATSSTSLYDNVGANVQSTGTGSQTTGQDSLQRQNKSDTSTMTNMGTITASVGTQNHVGSQVSFSSIIGDKQIANKQILSIERTR